jgi:hypothetical protein
MRVVVLETIRKAIPAGQLLLALVLTVLALRFAAVVAEPWLGGSVQQATKKISRNPVQSEASSRVAPDPPRRSVAPSTGVTRGKARAAAKGGGAFRLHTLISVTHGSQRSEVYVNGEFMGNTPYAGDVSCKRGEPVSVEIAPRNGPPIVREVICQSGPMEVAE